MNLPHLKKGLFFSGVIILTLLFGGCKAKHDDAEPFFPITFFPKTHLKKFEFCFTNVYAKGSNFSGQQCVDSGGAINVPYNIGSNTSSANDTSIYIFQYDAVHFDTLAITYNAAIDKDAESYFIQISKVNIIQCTFDSIKVTCNNDSIKVLCNDRTNPCNDIESIYIYM